MTEQPTTAPRRRVTLSDVVEGLLARSSTPGSESVEISRNAKGEAQFTVQARPQEDETLADALARAEATYDRLRRRYPFTTENGGGS